MQAAANFRQLAMDLARRLSSLQHYVIAARELISCTEHLQPKDIWRHTRKIVALIEISRQTLLRHGLRLYHFAACPSVLAPHKAGFFDVLRMLKRQTCFMDSSDHDLRGRIDRLLLPLSSNLRIAHADNTAICLSCIPHSAPLVSPPHSPVYLPSPTCGGVVDTNAIPRAHSRSDTCGKMLPPDMVMSTARQRRVHRLQYANHRDANDMNCALQLSQDASSSAVPTGAPVEKLEIKPMPVAMPKPRHRFGIFFASGARPGHRRSGSLR